MQERGPRCVTEIVTPSVTPTGLPRKGSVRFVLHRHPSASRARSGLGWTNGATAAREGRRGAVTALQWRFKAIGSAVKWRQGGGVVRFDLHRTTRQNGVFVLERRGFPGFSGLVVELYDSFGGPYAPSHSFPPCTIEAVAGSVFFSGEWNLGWSATVQPPV